VHAPGVAPSCSQCAATVIQAGISRVVYRGPDVYPTKEKGDAVRCGLAMFREAGVEVSRL
jgi:deoxycytidylate deaminase